MKEIEGSWRGSSVNNYLRNALENLSAWSADSPAPQGTIWGRILSTSLPSRTCLLKAPRDSASHEEETCDSSHTPDVSFLTTVYIGAFSFFSSFGARLTTGSVENCLFAAKIESVNESVRFR